MSHRATNWAIQQRGLPPATKLVLWHLCDRHNPDYGCFPSQDQLAADVEISRASLNTHLDRLERAGLIRRERRHEGDTHKRRSTRYFLGFEADFPGGDDPARPPKTHVQILDTGGRRAMSRFWTREAMSKFWTWKTSRKQRKTMSRIWTWIGRAMSNFGRKPCPDSGHEPCNRTSNYYPA